MSIEIFLSYRRTDAAGNARLLHDMLLRRFATEQVFFDEATLEVGDVFPQRITDAITDCRVLLALIGPGWASVAHAGKRRLDDPSDFVRQEIALALSLGKHVIPVLLENATMPHAAELPNVLAALASRNAHTQGGKKVEYDANFDRLIEALTLVPGVSPPRAPSAHALLGSRMEPYKLPLLCDRSLQDDATRNTIRAELQSGRRRPIVLVLHGRVDEEHHAFVERLEDFSLPRFLKGTPFASGVRFVRINEPLPVHLEQADFDRRLRERLGDAFDSGQVVDDATLLRHMQQQRISTLVAVVTWHASEFVGDPNLAMQRVFDYWSHFPQLGLRNLVGCIVCLKYDRNVAAGAWMRRIFGAGMNRVEALRAAVDSSMEAYAHAPQVAWCVAEELPSVTVADLAHWVSEVAHRTGHFRVPEEKLQAIIGGKARPMQPVLIELEKLVPAN